MMMSPSNKDQSSLLAKVLCPNLLAFFVSRSWLLSFDLAVLFYFDGAIESTFDAQLTRLASRKSAASVLLIRRHLVAIMFLS